MSQIYKTTEWPIDALVNAIKQGDIGLPDLQRPFVRDRTRVRNLFDSLFRGYPTGLILLLENETGDSIKHIGTNEKQHKIPHYVVIDGQQRLTSLYATITGFPIKKDVGNQEVITISFHPFEGKFEVANASTKQSTDRIYDIRDIIGGNMYEFTSNYLAVYEEKYGVDKAKANLIAENIQKVQQIVKITFSCIEISKSTSIEQVSDIFLRINSLGKTLNNSDFILTLMSVYREAGRERVENFADYTKKENDLVVLGADYVVRALMGVGFYRAKLEDAYKYLKAQTEKTEAFEQLLPTLEAITNTHNRKTFLSLIKEVGFINKKLVTQYSLVIACYIFYLIGITKFKLKFLEIAPLIKKYYLRMFLFGKYISSGESTLEKDLKRIEKCASGAEFIAWMHEEADQFPNNDAWNITLPKELISSSSRNHVFIAYLAAQVYYGKKILFKDTTLSSYMLATEFKETKSEIDLHHIFPKQYLLETYGMKGIDDTHINQVANKVYCYGVDNKIISSKSPTEYVQLFIETYGSKKVLQSLQDNDIYERFSELSYDDFLVQRRKDMLTKLKQFVDEISHPQNSEKQTNEHLITQGENHYVEFKSAFRYDLREQKAADYIKYQTIKTIAAFLNSSGGTLFIGVNDEGEILGLENDISTYQDRSLDSFLKDMDNLIKAHFAYNYAHIKVTVVGEQTSPRYCTVQVTESALPVYIIRNGHEEFYIRRSASSIALTLSESMQYIQERFKI